MRFNKSIALLKIVSAFSFLIFAANGRAENQCADELRKVGMSSVNTARATLTSDSERVLLDLEALANKIEQNRAALSALLTEIDNFHGADYEITQAIKTLRGVRYHEIDYLAKIRGVQNVAVYGSTNIPLYALILHAIIPSTVGAQIWFRTPFASRGTYIKVFKYLSDLGSFNFGRIHLLTDQRDVQYDYFRKVYVLGVSRSGNTVQRAPSEVVIFTGKPETGDKIISEIESKLKAMGPKVAAAKMLFLKFGSGLNPVVVTQYAYKQLDTAVEAAVEAIKINSSQDCIAPKFYVINKAMRREFLRRLALSLARLKFGDRSNPEADFSRLSFTDDFARLQRFRDQWKAYLLNPEAKIVASEKRVDPHVFVIPFEKFKEVDLVDHYAPFLVAFTYASDFELEEIANDPRVRSRAMFASLFGDPSYKEMMYLRKYFEDNFHSTILNQSVFTEESGNFPFGGYSANASASTLISFDGSGGVSRNQFNRPLLFSKETSSFFASFKNEAHYAQLHSAPQLEHSLEIYNQFIDSAENPGEGDIIGGQWRRLQSPLMKLRPHGLSVLRSAIAKSGLHVLIDRLEPSDELKRAQDIYQFGDDLVYLPPNRSLFPEQMAGVVLHPSYIGGEVEKLNVLRGDINPYLGYGFAYGLLSSGKVWEFGIADTVWPGSMPASVTYSQLATGESAADIERSRVALVNELERMSGSEFGFEEQNQMLDAVTDHVEKFFRLANRVFPQGAFIKNFEESTTGDLGNQITSFSQNARNYSRQFLDRYRWVANKVKKPYSDADFQNEMTRTLYETGAKMISRLLNHPKLLLIQQRVKVAKTDFGFPLEIRVDYVDGTAINSRARYSHEYLGPERKEAEVVLNKFFERAPPQIQLLAGGADLVKLETGEWMIIELNAGAASGSTSAETFPIETNLYLSKLRGRPTTMIQFLEETFASGLSGQKSFLLGLKQEKEKWHKKSPDEISLAEYARYFRDRYLDEWSKNPTEANAHNTLRSLKILFEGLGGPNNRDLPLLIMGAENYINQTLLKTTEAKQDAA